MNSSQQIEEGGQKGVPRLTQGAGGWPTAHAELLSSPWQPEPSEHGVERNMLVLEPYRGKSQSAISHLSSDN